MDMVWSFWMNRNRASRSAGNGSLAMVSILASVLLLPGCASYKSHYTTFTADNSAGEQRQVRLTWRTAEYPFWHWRSDRATPIRLETQCSRRVLQLYDPTMEQACTGDGIAGCGDPVLDLDRERRMLTSDRHVCFRVSDSEGSDRIMDLGSNVELTISCFPQRTEVDMGDETVNADYLRASVVPYNLRVRTARLGSMTERPPELDDRVCDLDDE